MPRIPVYDQPQTQQRAAPDVSVDSRLPTEGVNAIEAGMNQFLAAQKKQREELDNLRAEEAYNLLRQKQLDLAYGENGAFSVKGANVLNRASKLSLDEEYLQQFDKQASELSSTLANDEQRKRFNDRLAGARLEFSGHLKRHVDQEVGQWRDAVMKNTVDTETRLALQNAYDPQSIGQSVDRVRQAVGAMAVQHGLPADEATARAVGGIHAGVIAQALNDDRLDYARQYLAEFGKEIDPKDKMRLEGKLQAQDKEVRIAQAADEAFVYHSDNLVSGESLIRKKFADDPKAAHAALVMYEDRSRVLRAEEKRVANEHENAVLDMITSGKSWREVMRSTDWKAMDAKSRFALFDDYQRAQKSAAGGANSDAKEAAEAVFLDHMADDDRLARMPREEISLLRKQGLKQSQVNQLLKRKDTLAKGAENASVDADMLNAALDRNGVKSTDKQTRGRIKANVEAEIYADQQARGRALTREEKDRIISRQFLEVDVRHVGTGLLNKGDVSTEKKRYHEVGVKGAIQIPEPIRKKIIQEAQSNGVYRPRDEDVLRRYLDGSSRGEW